MPNEDIIILAIIFGSGVAIVTISLLYSLVKNWINRGTKGSVSEEEYDNLLQDLERFEASVNRRLQNLEAIVTNEDDVFLDKETEKKNNEKANRLESSPKEKTISSETGKEKEKDRDSDEYQSGEGDSGKSEKGRGLDNMLRS